MTTVTQLAASDATTRADNPTKPYGALTTIGVSSGGSARNVFQYFNRPFPIGATIISATLNLYQKGVAAGGTRTLTVARLSAKGPGESKITHNNKPGVTGTTATLALGNGGVSGRLWAVDVTAQMQTVSDGAAWYGFRYSSDISTLLEFFSRESSIFQPTLFIEWSDAPDAPSILAPSNGRAVSIARPTLRFDFTDVSGDTSMQGFELEMNATDVWTSPSFTTGVVASNTPEWALTFDVSVAAVWYWRVRVQDGAGIWSAWSDAASFTRTAKPTLTITNPAASPNDFVSEASPPLAWTATGQTAYQLFITDPVDVTKVLWTSGKVTSTDNAVTVPTLKPAILHPGGTYRMYVRVWDAVSRESTPGDQVYVAASRTFTFNLDVTVDPVTALFVAGAAPRPDAVMGWQRTTAPDSFTILRDGKVIDSDIEPSDLFAGGISYAYTDVTASPRTPHLWSVLAVVNGKASASNPTAAAELEPEGIWLSKTGGASVCITGADDPVKFEASEDATVHYPLGATNGVLVTQGVHGRPGTVEGFLQGAQSGLESITLSDWVEAFEDLRSVRGQTLTLTMVDTAIDVFIYLPLLTLGDELHGDIPISFSFCELL